MTGVSTLAQALNQINNITKQQTLFGTLNTQLATGKKTQQFSGLGNDALRSQRARASLASVDAYVSNIQRAQARVSLMLNSVNEFKNLSENFDGILVGFNQEALHQQGQVVEYDDPATDFQENTRLGTTSAEPDADFAELQRFADDLFTFLGTILNLEDGDRYLFTGSETGTKPFDEAGGLIDAAISSAIQDWKDGTISNEELIADITGRTATAANPNALTDTIVGFSAPLSSGNVEDIFLRVSDNQEIEYTVLANEQAFRDIMVALAFMKNPDLGPIADVYLPPNEPPNPPDVQGAPGADIDAMQNNFFEVFNAVMPMVAQAIDQLDQQRFKLETVNARIAKIEENYGQSRNVLLNTIGDVEDIDPNEVAVRLNTLQVQLEASFSITARLQELSLARFI